MLLLSSYLSSRVENSDQIYYYCVYYAACVEMVVSPVTTPAVSLNVTGQLGPHGPHVTAAVESAYSNALGRIVFQH